jgi:23S rRNA pseudouridine1911/1915/1917 synthase
LLNNQPEVTLTSYISQKSSLSLLQYLVKRFAYHSEAEWKERIETGKVLVNDHAASEGQPLRAGDEVAYTTSAWEEPPVNPNYRVIYEDEVLLAVSKPAPLPVHAIGAYFQNTFMSLLRRDRPEAQDYHLAHRLDSETSGVLLLAKDKPTLTSLLRQWDQGKVQKTYRAIVFGIFPEGETRFDAPIQDAKGGVIRMKGGIDVEKGKPSITDFKLLEVKSESPMLNFPRPLRERVRVRGDVDSNDFSLIEVHPITGRTHQIRVHLEHLGFPIVGDKLYAGNDEVFLHFYEHDFDDWVRAQVLLPRTALHAYRLELTHPATGKPLVLEDAWPEDLKTFWDGL